MKKEIVTRITIWEEFPIPREWKKYYISENSKRSTAIKLAESTIASWWDNLPIGSSMKCEMVKGEELEFFRVNSQGRLFSPNSIDKSWRGLALVWCFDFPNKRFCVLGCTRDPERDVNYLNLSRLKKRKMKKLEPEPVVGTFQGTPDFDFEPFFIPTQTVASGKQVSILDLQKYCIWINDCYRAERDGAILSDDWNDGLNLCPFPEDSQAFVDASVACLWALLASSMNLGNKFTASFSGFEEARLKITRLHFDWKWNSLREKNGNLAALLDKNGLLYLPREDSSEIPLGVFFWDVKGEQFLNKEHITRVQPSLMKYAKKGIVYSMAQSFKDLLWFYQMRFRRAVAVKVLEDHHSKELRVMVKVVKCFQREFIRREEKRINEEIERLTQTNEIPDLEDLPPCFKKALQETKELVVSGKQLWLKDGIRYPIAAMMKNAGFSEQVFQYFTYPYGAKMNSPQDVSREYPTKHIWGTGQDAKEIRCSTFIKNARQQYPIPGVPKCQYADKPNPRASCVGCFVLKNDEKYKFGDLINDFKAPSRILKWKHALKIEFEESKRDVIRDQKPKSKEES